MTVGPMYVFPVSGTEDNDCMYVSPISGIDNMIVCMFSCLRYR